MSTGHPPRSPRPGSAKASTPSKLKGVASRSYNVASTWEQSAPLTQDQISLIERISGQCAIRPIPQHVSESGARAPTPGGNLERAGNEGNGNEIEGFAGSVEDAVLQTSQNFYQWHAKLEAFRASEAEEKYREYADKLVEQLEACKRVGGVIDDTLTALDGVVSFHKIAVGRSQSLRETGERLVEERQQLIEFASAIRTRLFYFEELESIATEFHTLAASSAPVVEGQVMEAGEVEPYLPLLKRLDECITYVTGHPQYAESSLYASQFRRLQAQALGGIRHRVGQMLKVSVQKLQEGAGVGSVEDIEEGGEETSLLYVRFRALVEPALKTLLMEIEARSGRSEYGKLVEDCQKAFAQARLTLMKKAIDKRVESLCQEPLDGLVRNGFYYLVQVCRAEHQLFCRFFPSTANLSVLTVNLVEPLGNVLYDALRPMLIQIQEVGRLCETVEILKKEVINEQMNRWGEALEPLRPVVLRTLADSQERLTYRTQAFIRDGIANYEAVEEDLDYPNCLESSGKEQPPPAGGQSSKNEEEGVSDAIGGIEGSSKWYPPLQMVLVYLSRLYHCLEPRIFGGLAHEAVLACAGSIAKAGRLIGEKSGRMDGQLFTIRHLLLLREQIAVYKAEFSVVEKDLDFSHMRDHLRRILMGETSLFTFSSNNAVLQLVSRGGPRVFDNQIDSKKRLEKQLKESCEELIMLVTKMTVEPMLSFITKVTIRGTSRSTSVQTAGTRPLRELAFASVERVTETVKFVNDSLKSTLPETVAKMKLYLPNQSTHAILFKPIKSNISEAHAQVASIFQREYEKEEVANVGLLAPRDLIDYLEGLN
ncbi:hypothetical protein BSKO_12016 [Bryopsis sp. KO-2023]|nr:hypothetical protein BSKO_12016 [Bryopsis sp. KO-2023]